MQLDLVAEVEKLNHGLRDALSKQNWEERDRVQYEKWGMDKEHIEVAILGKKKFKKNLALFEPSGEKFNFDSVYTRYNFTDDFLDIDFLITLPVNYEQVDLESSANTGRRVEY